MFDFIACKVLGCRKCTGDPYCPQLVRFNRENHAALTAPTAQLKTARLIALWFPRLGDVITDEQLTLFDAATERGVVPGVTTTAADFVAQVGAVHDGLIASDFEQPRARAKRKEELAQRRRWQKQEREQ